MIDTTAANTNHFFQHHAFQQCRCISADLGFYLFAILALSFFSPALMSTLIFTSISKSVVTRLEYKMLNFILAVLVFIAYCFPPSKTKAIDRRKGELERRVGDRRAGFCGEGKAVQESGIPRSSGYMTATQDDSPADELPLTTDLKRTTVDVSTQTEDIVSDHDGPNTTSQDILAHTEGPVVEESCPGDSPAPAAEIGETRPFDFATRTPEYDLGSSSPSSSLNLGATLVNTPTEWFASSTMEQDNHEHDVRSENSGEETQFATGTMGLVNSALSSIMLPEPKAEPAGINAPRDHEQEGSDSPIPLPEAQKVDNSVSSEAAASTPQGNRENTAANESRSTVHEQRLKDEEAAHQQTHAELVRIEGWCQNLQDENETLQAQVSDARREQTSMQRHLDNAEDGNLRLQIELSDAEGKIRGLSISVEESFRTIQALQNQAVGLKGDVAWYNQLGTDFYVRLQKVEEDLHPADRVFAVYQSLMRDTAQLFAEPVEVRGEDGDDCDDSARIEEIDDDGRQEGEGAQAGANDTLLNDDHGDEILHPDRPMRPGTAGRVPISVFAASPAAAHNNPPSSPFENRAQQGSPAGAPTFPINFAFASSANSGAESATMAQDPRHGNKASKNSNRGRSGRGGIERGNGSRRQRW